MKSYDVYFSPRPSHIRVFLETLAFRLHAGPLQRGLLHGDRLGAPTLDKHAAGRSGLLCGADGRMPGIESHAGGEDALLHGGRFDGSMEKDAAGGAGLLTGERAAAILERRAEAGSGLLFGGCSAVSSEEASAFALHRGTLTGAGFSEWKEVKSSVPSGTLTGAALGADIESPAEAVGGLLVGGTLRGGSRVVRLRPLSDLDAKGALSQIDGQTLGELDYMIVEE